MTHLITLFLIIKCLYGSESCLEKLYYSACENKMPCLHGNNIPMIVLKLFRTEPVSPSHIAFSNISFNIILPFSLISSYDIPLLFPKEKFLFYSVFLYAPNPKSALLDLLAIIKLSQQ